MNYKKHYDLLIEKSKNRILEEKSEKHHIVPKCFGGTNDWDNIAILTLREHYIAHLLLLKMQTTKRKKFQMSKAIIIMSSRNVKFNSKLFELKKIEVGKYQSYFYSKENHPMYGVHRYGKLNPFYGKTHSLETRKKLSEIAKNLIMVKNLQTGKNERITKEKFEQNDFYVGITSGVKLNKDQKYKCGKAFRNKIYINDGKEEKRINLNELDDYENFQMGRLKHVCPHCGTECDIRNLKRWHLNNCRHNI